MGSISSVSKQEKHNSDPAGGLSNNNGGNNNSNKESSGGGFGQKFTTSNFTQSVVMKSDSVFGNGGGSDTKGMPLASATGAASVNQNNTGSTTMSTSSGTKKRKSDGRITSGTNIDEINK